MNEDLLYRVAKVYYELERERLGEMVFVFPNHRAGLFFLKHLSTFIDRPIFQPQVLAINELFASLSTLRLAEPTDLLFRLYQIYNEVTKGQSSFDKFLFWGKMMLSDFQEIDQHLVNAKELLGNIRDLKDIEEHFQLLISQGFATESDLQSAQAFVQHLGQPNEPDSEHYNEYKHRFLTIWDTLLPCYERLRDNLRKDNLAYAGMLQREVVEMLRESRNANPETRIAKLETRYVFIGFNALTQVERELMKLLNRCGKADFYWDYDAPALRDPNNQASFYYYHNNRSDFAPTLANEHLHARLQELPPTRALEGKKPQITLLRMPTRVGQANAIASILEELQSSKVPEFQTSRVQEFSTGIVLADEGMLQPLLHHLPATVDKVNITMGYPLSLTSVYAMLTQMSELLTLHKETENGEWLYYFKPVLSLLAHPYIQTHCATEAADIKQVMLKENLSYINEKDLSAHPLLSQLFHHPTSNADLLSNLEQLLYTLRISRKQYDDEAEFLGQALRQVRNFSVLLEKYPNILMETKTLFSMLLQLIESRPVPYEGEPLEGLQIMGVLESRSMVFQNLILTNCNDEIFPGSKSPNSFIPYDLRAYYKLPTPQLEDAIFAYNFYRLLSHSERVWMMMDTRTNDMSEGEVSRYIQQLKYQYGYEIEELGIRNLECGISEPQGNSQLLIPNSKFQIPNSFSPSALNTYVRCPRKFYLTYVQKLRQPEEISETIELYQLGDVVHKVMQALYEGQHDITQPLLEQFKERVEHTDLVENIYKQEIYKEQVSPTFTGLDHLMVRIAKQYVLRYLDYDLQIVPFEYIGSEKFCKTHVQVNDKNIELHGFIDRIDRVNGQLRIVDYKTGAVKEDDHARQTMIYCKAFMETQERGHKTQDAPIPVIYYVKEGAKRIQYDGQFEADLTALIEEILNPENTFPANWEEQNCNDFCPFAEICKIL